MLKQIQFIQKTALSLAASASLLVPCLGQANQNRPEVPEDIKSYCLDFNWAPRKGFAEPGLWNGADPKATVEWHKTIGSNVIQTFCVSTNGYAWYKNGVVPEQPGLKHDFLRETVKLGHAEGMLVMGYFCISANTRWGEENPELSYGTPSKYHIPFTDEYLAYLDEAIRDAVSTTGIDGFMIDWVWMPTRKSTDGKWIEAEKKLYQQLMREPFPGEDQLTKQQDLEYSRKAIDRCWKTIRKAAKEANPDCIIWLTTNTMHHPHVVDSNMYRQADWVMGEAGRTSEIVKAKPMVGKDAQLITCLALWNGVDPTVAVPEALAEDIGLYGFAKPTSGDGTIKLDRILPKQISELSGDEKNIAVLARAYHGKSIDSVWNGDGFVEPENPPPFRIKLRGRSRGWDDTAHLTHEDDKSIISIRNPYQSGRSQITRTGSSWPDSIVVRLLKKKADIPGPNNFRVANGSVGISIQRADNSVEVIAGRTEEALTLNQPWKIENFLNRGQPESPLNIGNVPVRETDEAVEIILPSEILDSNPEQITFEWGSGRVR